MTNNTPNNFTRFLRNNAALLVIIFCVLAISAVVIVASVAKPSTTVVTNPTGNSDEPTVTPVDEPEPTPQIVRTYFTSPVSGATVTMDYTDLADVLFVFNSTLDTWQTHKAVDLSADEGASVCAMFDGTVVDVSENYGYGNTVKIDHGDGVVVTFASLGEVSVTNGQKVTRGEEIGTVGTSASYEFCDGAHVHVEVAKDGTSVDPRPYVHGEVFRDIQH